MSRPPAGFAQHRFGGMLVQRFALGSQILARLVEDMQRQSQRDLVLQRQRSARINRRGHHQPEQCRVGECKAHIGASHGIKTRPATTRLRHRRLLQSGQIFGAYRDSGGEVLGLIAAVQKELPLATQIAFLRRKMVAVAWK